MPPHTLPSCLDCSVQRLALYASFIREEMREIQGLRREARRIAPNNMIVSAGERFTTVATLRDGWAFRYLLLADGRRQIFSHYLPGDLIAVEALQSERAHFSVRSLTSVTLCSFELGDFKRLLNSKPALAKAFLELCGKRSTSMDRRLTDIGRRPAEERLIRFLLHIYGRFLSKGLVVANSFPFPLRQQHIGDTLGLTPVHVSRTFRKLKERGFLNVENNKITILDERALLGRAELRGDFFAEIRERLAVGQSGRERRVSDSENFGG